MQEASIGEIEALWRYETGGKTTREHLKSNTPVNEVLGYMKNSLDTQEIRRKYQIDIVKDGSTDVIGQADPLRSYTSEIEIFQENEKKIKVKLMVGVEPIFMCVQIADIGSVCPNNYWKTHMWNTLESCEETRDDTSEPVGSLCSDYSCTCRKVAN